MSFIAPTRPDSLTTYEYHGCPYGFTIVLRFRACPHKNKFLWFALWAGEDLRGNAVKTIFASAAVVAAILVSPAALAQERAVNTALGTAAGLIVFGPVGAVAGAAVGYTAGQGIANAWGMRRPARKVRRTTDR